MEFCVGSCWWVSDSHGNSVPPPTDRVPTCQLSLLEGLQVGGNASAVEVKKFFGVGSVWSLHLV